MNLSAARVLHVRKPCEMSQTGVAASLRGLRYSVVRSCFRGVCQLVQVTWIDRGVAGGS